MAGNGRTALAENGTRPVDAVIARFGYPQRHRAIAVFAMRLVKAVPAEIEVAVRIDAAASRKRHIELRVARENFVLRPVLAAIQRNGYPRVDAVTVCYRDSIAAHNQLVFIVVLR